jgi:hypothetical protein
MPIRQAVYWRAALPLGHATTFAASRWRRAHRGPRRGTSSCRHRCRFFEADLPPEQYAYRPGRNAQQAVVEVEAQLFRGHPEVVDADLADYFGSIPHAELLKSVARRFVDRRVLHLIKMWLECPVEETDDRGRKTRTTEARDNRRGLDRPCARRDRRSAGRDGGTALGYQEQAMTYPLSTVSSRGLREDETRWRFGLPGACEHW